MWRSRVRLTALVAIQRFKKIKYSHRKAQTGPIWSRSQAEVMHTPRRGWSHSECKGEREVWVWRRNKGRGDAGTSTRRLSAWARGAREPRSYSRTQREQIQNRDRQKERKQKGSHTCAEINWKVVHLLVKKKKKAWKYKVCWGKGWKGWSGAQAELGKGVCGGRVTLACQFSSGPISEFSSFYILA